MSALGLHPVDHIDHFIISFTSRHREQTFGCQEGNGFGEGWSGRLAFTEAAFLCRMDKQVPTVWHKGLYSISCDKP